MNNPGPKTCLERAFELARSGNYRTVSEIKRRLKQERHMNINATLDGLSIKQALMKVCEESGGRPLRPARVGHRPGAGKA